MNRKYRDQGNFFTGADNYRGGRKTTYFYIIFNTILS